MHQIVLAAHQPRVLHLAHDWYHGIYGADLTERLRHHILTSSHFRNGAMVVYRGHDGHYFVARAAKTAKGYQAIITHAIKAHHKRILAHLNAGIHMIHFRNGKLHAVRLGARVPTVAQRRGIVKAA